MRIIDGVRYYTQEEVEEAEDRAYHQGFDDGRDAALEPDPHEIEGVFDV